MQKVRAFEVAGAIEQAGRGHVPDVDRPEAECEEQPVGAEALGGEKLRREGRHVDTYNKLHPLALFLLIRKWLRVLRSDA